MAVALLGWVELFAKPITIAPAADGFLKELNPSYDHCPI
jgi:hypothetical protein